MPRKTTTVTNTTDLQGHAIIIDPVMNSEANQSYNFLQDKSGLNLMSKSLQILQND